MELLDLAVLGVFSLFLGAVTGASGLNLSGARFPAVAQVESSVPASVGTTIGITATVTISTALSYVRAGNIHRRILYLMISVGVVGCLLGAYFTALLPSLAVMTMIMGSLLWSTYRMFRVRNISPTSGSVALTRKRYARESLSSFIVGTIGGMLGVILANITLASLINTFGMEPKTVIGTTLAFSAVLGIFGIFAHLAYGNINFIILGVMGSAGMIGGVVGSRFVGRIDAKKIKIMLIIVQLSVFVYLAVMVSIEIIRPAAINCSSCF